MDRVAGGRQVPEVASTKSWVIMDGPRAWIPAFAGMTGSCPHESVKYFGKRCVPSPVSGTRTEFEPALAYDAIGEARMDLPVLQRIALELDELLRGGFINKIHQPLPRRDPSPRTASKGR